MLFPPKSKRHWSGKVAQKRGDDVEKKVHDLHQQPAFIRAYPGVCLTRRHARKVLVKGRMQYTAEQGPDFGGGGPASVLCPEINRDVGVWCEVEVKFIEAQWRKGELVGRLQFDHFTNAEVRILTACSSAGGVAIVLVLVGPAVGVATWCAVPWHELDLLVKAYRDSLNHLGKKQRDAKGKVVSDVPASVNAAWLLRFKCQPIDYLKRSL